MTQNVYLKKVAITHFTVDGKPDIDAELKALVEFDKPDYSVEIIEMNKHNHVMYAAVRHSLYRECDGYWVSTVIPYIIPYSLKRKAEVLSYCIYTDIQCPPYYDCALKVLKVLTECQKPECKQWRKQCMEKIHNKKRGV